MGPSIGSDSEVRSSWCSSALPRWPVQHLLSQTATTSPVAAAGLRQKLSDQVKVPTLERTHSWQTDNTKCVLCPNTTNVQDPYILSNLTE